MRAVLLAVAALTLGGCASRATGTTGAVQADTLKAELDRQAAQEAAEDAARHHHKQRLPPDVVARAALPMHGVVLETGVEIEPDRLADALSQADAICIGEDHPDPHQHWAEEQLLLRVLERASMSGREVGLGLEMVERPNQSVLDRFNEKKLRLNEVAKELDWDKTWGFDFALYAPLFAAARSGHAPVLALDPAEELVSKVAQGGLDALDDAERRNVPPLDLDVAAHRKRFDAAMQGHPHVGDPGDMYLAQVLRDETMAETAAKWLAKGAPARQLVIVAGAEHCRHLAVPARIHRRHDARVVSVRPYVAADDDKPDLDGYEYAAVMSAGD